VRQNIEEKKRDEKWKNKKSNKPMKLKKELGEKKV
jgi:hypothetical protein